MFSICWRGVDFLHFVLIVDDGVKTVPSMCGHEALIHGHVWPTLQTGLQGLAKLKFAAFYQCAELSGLYTVHMTTDLVGTGGGWPIKENEASQMGSH